MRITKVRVQPASMNSRQGEPAKFAAKIYINPSGETLLENLTSRSQRPYTVWKREVLPSVIELIKQNHPDQAGYFEEPVISWSKNCGCSICPCSPGFIVTGSAQFSMLDVFVTIDN